MSKHIDDSLERLREIFQKASNRIEALKVGQKIPATVLAEEIAKEYGMTGPQLYPTLLFLINKNYPDVEIKRGAHGGIFKLAAGSTDAKKAATVTMENIVEDKTLPIINS